MPKPMTNPVSCMDCGYTCAERDIPTRQTLPEVRTPPGEPAEYRECCPKCGSEDFEEAILCDECNERPCICDAANFDDDDRKDTEHGEERTGDRQDQATDQR